MSEEVYEEVRESVQWETSVRPDLYTALADSPSVDHLALLYDSHEERLDATLSFLQLGLENNERCIYVAHEVSKSEIVEGFQALGGDPKAALASGQLEIRSAADLYLGKEFDPEGIVSELHDVLEESKGDSYDGLRITGQIPWKETEGISFDDVLEYERKFDSHLSDFDFAALCQYDLPRLTNDEVIDIVQVHPKIIYRRQVCDNPFYHSPAELAQLNGSPVAAERVLDATYRLTSAREEIQRREQRVGVLNRVLRHNLRNEMNVVQSHAELIESAVDDPAVAESVTTILETTGRLMEIAEDAKRVEKSVSGTAPDRIPVNLKHAIDRAADRSRKDHTDVAITSNVEDDTWVESSEELEFALGELFETLARLADEGSKIVVETDPDGSSSARLCVVVRCEKASLPEAEIQALIQGEETQLSHGSGLGLWLVNWIVELSGGKLSFRSPEGVFDQVTIELLRA